MQPFWGEAVTVMSSLFRFIWGICEQEHTQLAFEHLELAHLQCRKVHQRILGC
jgi:hypothetical protein